MCSQGVTRVCAPSLGIAAVGIEASKVNLEVRQLDTGNYSNAILLAAIEIKPDENGSYVETHVDFN